MRVRPGPRARPSRVPAHLRCAGRRRSRPHRYRRARGAGLRYPFRRRRLPRRGPRRSARGSRGAPDADPSVPVHLGGRRRAGRTGGPQRHPCGRPGRPSVRLRGRARTRLRRGPAGGARRPSARRAGGAPRRAARPHRPARPGHASAGGPHHDAPGAAPPGRLGRSHGHQRRRGRAHPDPARARRGRAGPLPPAHRGPGHGPDGRVRGPDPLAAPRGRAHRAR